MNVINASFEIIHSAPYIKMLEAIEQSGRTCYKSEKGITYDSATKFIRNLIKRGHESVLEHQSISVRIVCDRGVSHELVRHRIASFSQESTRYCNYSKKGVTFIKPCFWREKEYFYSLWYRTMETIEQSYLYMIERDISPQEARTILPNSLKTEIVVTQNLRQWRHFFKLRALGTSGAPHPQMLEITVPMLAEFQSRFPVFFDDLVKEQI